MSYLNYFTKIEWTLWLSSISAILMSAFWFGEQAPLALAASLIGVTSLIFSAKANPIGQGLVIIFSIIYAYLSLRNSYYGELMTYLFMTLPMAIFSLFAWLNHPFEGKKSQVTISRLESADSRRLIMFTLVVILVFYGVLASLKTAYLLVSTLSIATSFSAVYLSYKRSPYFALAYGLNDLVLILLWLHAAQTDSSQYAVVICFATFLINDLYTFCSWLHLQHYQEKSKKG
ncbi:nicotinamide riboside transporter PnuC [Streptococcus dysgalactiae]|uniref:nicotinamide riboside transporter PnuC n=1 Tax=Streptococcus dysgalactiae TaxID=1334 RepID=UPI00232D66DA|nr:nicotinamide riboside transporter PnuC [Streptococcus dysgalactiae]WCE86206.1 nicotinamide riboside transporter PnuC [Streptococcus dysgalactiae]WCN26202.1 nicotinamide riboside transporter PnuC [Streptococcus dysgalactiae]